MAEKVTIIIPNYNGMQLLKNCIKSLERQTCTDFRLLIIDNGSTDGSQLISSDILNMEMIRLSENTGFCKAVNIGLRRTKTPYAILLNNDTEAHPLFVEKMLEAIKGKKRVFSCSSCMIDYKDRSVIDNAGDLYTVLGWAVGRGKGKKVLRYKKRAVVFSCCGGASIYRMDILKKIGLLDENHFAYLEDVDLGYRANIYGYYNLYEPKAKVYHIGSATTGTRYNEKKVFLAARNSVYVVYKNMPSLQILCNMPFLFAGMAVKLLFFVRKGLAAKYIKGICAGIKGAKNCKKVPFISKNLKNYIRIEMALFWNVFRILLRK